MPVEFITDEHIPGRIGKSLIEAGCSVRSIFHSHRGLSDPEILELCKRAPSVLITADKDFAAWAAAGKPNNVGIILLRYERAELPAIEQGLVTLCRSPDSLIGCYTVLSPTKTRRRTI